MQAFLVSDHEVIGNRVRQILLKEGVDCPVAQVVTLAQAAQRLVRAQPELVVVMLNPDPERALAALDALTIQAPTRVLVVGPASDPKLVLRALRGGGDDYVDEAELETELPAALARRHGG